jgi:hypothetical protein
VPPRFTASRENLPDIPPQIGHPSGILYLVIMSDNANSQADTEQVPADFPIPPASIEFLVLSLKAQAEMQLGLLYFGDEKDRPEPDLRVARHTIDILALLQAKTRGNLTMDEERLMENSLTELRFRYVQAVETSGKTKAGAQA